MKSHVLREKSFWFAVKIVRFCRQMASEHKEYVISKQLLASGTAPGALIRESQYAESTPDFKHKYSIALKEANETEYWLDVIVETFPDLRQEALALKRDCKEIIAMLVASTKTLKQKLLK